MNTTSSIKRTHLEFVDKPQLHYTWHLCDLFDQKNGGRFYIHFSYSKITFCARQWAVTDRNSHLMWLSSLIDRQLCHCANTIIFHKLYPTKFRMDQDCRLLPGDVPCGWLRFHNDLSGFKSDKWLPYWQLCHKYYGFLVVFEMNKSEFFLLL